MNESIPNRYDPQEVESRWYRFWEEKGYFRPLKDLAEDPGVVQTLNAEEREQLAELKQTLPTAETYSITIPPPNVTGSLHMGHALNHSIMDALIRWKRMQGFNTLCLPGTDHAGIATQNVVEKALRKEGKSRHDLGREAFVERVWEWVHEYGNTIVGQLKRLGCSYDWNRLRFTLDKEYADAVLEVFVRWWDDKLLYLGSRVVNWCPRCQSVISDIEVNAKEKQGQIWHIQYPFADGSGFVTVATTRPETMLGDVAVAVNPEDERYKGLIGKTLILPLVNREIPLVADPYPDPEFGSGAVKITPAHDPNDFEVGQRHNLPMPVVLDRGASVDLRALRAELGQAENAYLDSYQGLDRYAAREKIVEDLKALDLLVDIKPHTLAIGHCDRCDTVIEPLLSEQWFADMQSLSKPATEVVESGDIKIIPDRYTGLYLNWMNNIRDWPISRQLWWGHQIPAYYCLGCHPEDFEKRADGSIEILKRRDPVVAKTEPEKCDRCGGGEFVRDPWVLDTWFSSAIWPQTTLGWPAESDDVKTYYPTSVLTTDKGILYLWVARMIMTGLYFKNEIPFHDVYIHATVLDAQGRRMSKSLGTGIDPLDLIEKFGADGTRFALLQQAGMNQEIRFGEQRVEQARNFCNKIWNASRFVMMNLDQEFTTRLYHDRLPDKTKLEEIDRWIISRYQRTVAAVNEALGQYQFDDAARALYDFIWNEFCDWYIEAVKPRLYDDARKRVPQTVLTYLLERTLRLLHPFMPFLTEEIWHALPHTGDSLSLARYPQQEAAWVDEAAEASFEMLQDVTRAARNLRAEVGITPGQKIDRLFVAGTNDEATRVLTENADLIKTFAWFNEVAIGQPDAETKRIEATATGADVYLPIEGVIDTEKECGRLRKELEKAEADLNLIRGKLRNPQFLERAPAAVVAKDRALEGELVDKLGKLNDRLKMFGCS